MSPVFSAHRVTEGAWWRLSTHFFRALFDFGVLTEAGADSLKHLLMGSIGGFVAAAWLMVVIYVDKYLALWFAPSPESYRRALLGDDMFLIAVPMLMGASITLLVSSSLFPDERDFRILGPLPIRRGVVFGAKLAALGLLVASFVTLTEASLLPLFLLISRNPFGEHAYLPRLLAWLVASGAASAFAMLTTAAGVGLLGLPRTTARLQALTTTVKSLAFGLLVLSVPFVFRLSDLGGHLANGAPWIWLVPPAWFVGLERALMGSRDPLTVSLAATAVVALGVAAASVAVLYTHLFRHFERLVLRPPVLAPANERARRPHPRPGAPAYLAVRLFTERTMRRGGLYQGVLIGLTACGCGVAANGLMGDNWTEAALWAPFAVMFACGLGVRASLALPTEHRANWVFRSTEDERMRADQLRAVNDLAAWWLALPPTVLTLPWLWAALRWQALVAAAVVLVVGLVAVHAVLFDWRRIPFTCSYLPGKRFVAQSLFLGIGACVAFAWGGAWLVRGAVSSGAGAVLVIGAGLALAKALHRRRMNAWAKSPLMFEDEFPDALMALDLWH
jgi:hypothetical protein